MLKQWVKILLANKDKNAAVIFFIYIEGYSKARNRDLGFTNAR